MLVVRGARLHNYIFSLWIWSDFQPLRRLAVVRTHFFFLAFLGHLVVTGARLCVGFTFIILPFRFSCFTLIRRGPSWPSSCWGVNCAVITREQTNKSTFCLCEDLRWYGSCWHWDLSDFYYLDHHHQYRIQQFLA